MDIKKIANVILGARIPAVRGVELSKLGGEMVGRVTFSGFIDKDSTVDLFYTTDYESEKVVFTILCGSFGSINDEGMLSPLVMVCMLDAQSEVSFGQFKWDFGAKLVSINGALPILGFDEPRKEYILWSVCSLIKLYHLGLLKISWQSEVRPAISAGLFTEEQAYKQFRKWRLDIDKLITVGGIVWDCEDIAIKNTKNHSSPNRINFG